MKKTILSSEIELRFHPSKFLWGWWLVFSIAVLVCLWICLPFIWAGIVTLMYGLTCVWQWTQLLATRWKWSVQSLNVDVFGQMTVVNTLGQVWRIKVMPDSVVHPMCMALHIAYLELQAGDDEEGDSVSEPILCCWLRPKRVLILFDHTDADSQQALRVWLKWGLRE